MEILTITLDAGQIRRFERAGSYFEIIQADGRLSVELLGRAGELADDMVNALAGFYSEEPFWAITIGNVEEFAQTVRVMITNRRGGSRRQPGDVSVIDMVQSGAKFATNDGLATPAGFTAVPLVLPAANVAGLTVLSAAAIAMANATGWAVVQIVAGQTAPVNGVGMNNAIMLARAYSINGAHSAAQDFNMRRRIPAGWGIWHTFEINGNTAQIVTANLSYQLLT